jgi:Transglycosylase SLT domain
MGVQPISVPQSLAYVLNSAGQKNGVDFDYLLQTAMRESSLNPKAKAQTSSATGLFQFIESTWLQVMKSDGPRLGYQAYADAIQMDGEGDYFIKDAKIRQEVLALREDPQIAADLAAAFTKNNGDYLRERFGRTPSPGELYIAHFLGAKGAEKMFVAGLSDPDQIAAKLFPKQAKANPSIFYSEGSARTIKQVYRALVAKHEAPSGVDPKFAAQQYAAAGVPAIPQEVIPSRFGPQDMSFTGLFTTEEIIAPRTLLTEPDVPEAGGAFFTQLYAR